MNTTINADMPFKEFFEGLCKEYDIDTEDKVFDINDSGTIYHACPRDLLDFYEDGDSSERSLFAKDILIRLAEQDSRDTVMDAFREYIRDLVSLLGDAFFVSADPAD